MSEQTWMIDPVTGDLLVEGLSLEEASALAANLLPPGQEIGCAQPLVVLPPPAATPDEVAESICVRIAGYYHNSLVEGPGRRSSTLVTGCPLRCRGCAVPHLHAPDPGALVPADRLAAALLDPGYTRDGISILGGEPTSQPEGLLELIRCLRARGCPHILCYSGYTYEALRRRGRHQPALDAVLNEIDVLVDGPYIAALAKSAGPWTGSGNQRVIDLATTRHTGHLVLLQSPGHSAAHTA